MPDHVDLGHTDAPAPLPSPASSATAAPADQPPAAPAMTHDEVARLAGLARIDLSDDELDHLAPQLAVILESVTTVNAVAADDIPPTSHALPLRNVFRDDKVQPSLTPQAALAAAPAVEQQRFSVPRILDEEA